MSSPARLPGPTTRHLVCPLLPDGLPPVSPLLDVELTISLPDALASLRVSLLQEQLDFLLLLLSLLHRPLTPTLLGCDRNCVRSGLLRPPSSLLVLLGWPDGRGMPDSILSFGGSEISHLPLSSLNDGFRLSMEFNQVTCVLVPKRPNQRDVSHFHPISILGTLYKIIAKLLSLWLVSVMSSILNPFQIVFIKGRRLQDVVVLTNEVVHSLCCLRLSSFILKLDISNAFDSVNWEFLSDLLTILAFVPSRSWTPSGVSIIVFAFHLRLGIRPGRCQAGPV
ncbi:Transposon TX1 uncharacterized protein [Nymphaea thermarum]|nr:Transposon TX1 uncharacterized protein [Nymphaea thermarum]